MKISPERPYTSPNTVRVVAKTLAARNASHGAYGRLADPSVAPHASTALLRRSTGTNVRLDIRATMYT